MARKKEVKKVTKKSPTRKTSFKKVSSVSENVMSSGMENSKKPAKRKNYFVLIVFLLLLGAFLYYAKSLFVVAVVNGKPITRWSVIRQLEKTSGQTALDGIVNQVLIDQEVKKEGIVVTDEDVQAELDKVKKQLEDQGATLDQLLASRGMTIEDAKEQIKIQKTAEEILKDDIKVSDDEVKKYYEDNKDLFGNDAKFEDLQDSIKEQLKNDKLTTAFQTWYTKLKSEANIKYFISY